MYRERAECLHVICPPPLLLGVARCENLDCWLWVPGLCVILGTQWHPEYPALCMIRKQL